MGSGKSTPSAPMIVSSTSRGTARKNHVNAQATPARTGLLDRRITATTTPSVTPISIDPAVPTRVPMTSPRSTGDWIIASKTKDQLNAGLVSSRWMNIAASTAMITMTTQRPG